ncbi:hypothetical protein B0T21DRAFT_454116 [Apiosordaria backusii]|uniref:Uncharacterized protein n=1 Tax=Apiosordaria backusii TaxID=314023 RepID=A0AA40ANA3_9PEZI|nr:hypothetical protein B0T21DRAFT_454116 [Apiosordaria backusii]
MVRPPSTGFINAGFELYTALEQSATVSQACSSASSSARNLYNRVTNTTPSPLDSPHNRSQKRNWIQSATNWQDDVDDIPTLDSMAYSPVDPTNTTIRGGPTPRNGYQAVRVLLLSWENQHKSALQRTKIMRRLEDLFRDEFNFVVYSYHLQQPPNPGETIDGAFFSWLMANKFLVNLDPQNERELVIIIYDGNTGLSPYNDFRLYSSQSPERNSVPWDLLQKRFLQAPYDTLQVFNWTYHHNLSSPQKHSLNNPPSKNNPNFSPENNPKTVRNPRGTNLLLSATSGPLPPLKKFSKSDHWQLLFLAAFHKALLDSGPDPLSVDTIHQRILIAHEEAKMKEVDTPKLFRLPSGHDDEEEGAANKSIVIASLGDCEPDGWVLVSHYDYWSQRSSGGR